MFLGYRLSRVPPIDSKVKAQYGSKKGRAVTPWVYDWDSRAYRFYEPGTLEVI